MLSSKLNVGEGVVEIGEVFGLFIYRMEGYVDGNVAFAGVLEGYDRIIGILGELEFIVALIFG